MDNNKYLVGIDFGTDSVRSIVVNSSDGREIASHVAYYSRWRRGLYCDPSHNRFRQHPLDYIEGLKESVIEALKDAGDDVRERVVGIGVDTTGSTPSPVDRDGTVLALKEEFRDNPNAMFVLWKDHTAVEEAEDINRTAKSWGGTDYTKYVGGVYSSEWFWAKMLHILRNDPEIRENAFSWVEHADWIPALLTGNLDPLTMKRSRCAAGHKAMWHEEWGGLPPEEFLTKIDPLYKGIHDRLYSDTYTSDISAGGLTGKWAKELGLKEGIEVAVGAFDAHMGAVGSEIKENTLVKILGTSCCDMAVATHDTIAGKLIGGICGQVDGSIIPGMIGLEAGQSAFGDIYAWFRDVLSWPIENMLAEELGVDEWEAERIKERLKEKLVMRLSEKAFMLKDETMWPIALDWLNGRRSPYADQKLKGAILGLTLGTDAVRIFRALVEATAFGAKAIIERFREEGVVFDEVVASGGIPKKSPFVMQVMSDVLGIPVKVARSQQAGALGAAMCAAVASGVYRTVKEAQRHMGNGFETTYNPNEERHDNYKKMYARYSAFSQILEEHLRK